MKLFADTLEFLFLDINTHSRSRAISFTIIKIKHCRLNYRIDDNSSFCFVFKSVAIIFSIGTLDSQVYRQHFFHC